jgi:hypothetical protein
MISSSPKREEDLRALDYFLGDTALLIPPEPWSDEGYTFDRGRQHGELLTVLYINLEESHDRRESMERELRPLDVGLVRVPGIRESYGSLGCLKSHVKTLEIASQISTPWVGIFEDDFQFSHDLTATQEKLDFLFKNQDLSPVWMGAFEVNGAQPDTHPDFPFLKVANGACNTTSCYFVRRDYIPTLLKTWQTSLKGLIAKLEELTQLKRDGQVDNIRAQLWRYDCDVAWTPLQKRDKWLIFDPVMGYQNREEFESVIIPAYLQYEEQGYLKEHED